MLICIAITVNIWQRKKKTLAHTQKLYHFQCANISISMCVFFSLSGQNGWIITDTVVSVNKCVLPFNVGIYRLLACCRRPLSFLYHYDVRSIEYFWMLQHLFCMLVVYAMHKWASERASERARVLLFASFCFCAFTMASSQWTVRVVRITFADTIVSFK